MTTVDCIMLIDDHPPTNLIHEMIIRNNLLAKQVITFTDAAKAFEYLKQPFTRINPRPNIIFLDINMPGMDGWDFLEQYEALETNQKSEVVIMMLSTSLHPQDSAKAKANPLIDTFLSKPLTKEMVRNIIDENFQKKMKDNLKIMLVDDYEPTNILHKEFILSLFPDKEIEAYTDPFKAINAIKEQDENLSFIPNIIFLDINMPLMSGWEFLEAFKLIPNIQEHNITIYMLSTFDEERYSERALAHPYVKDYFTKPLTEEKLRQLFIN